MSQRSRRFDVQKLVSIAAASVGANSCLRVEKFPDGMYDKAFLLPMDNGMQAVAVSGTMTSMLKTSSGPQLHGLERPCLPTNLAQLDSDAQKEANALHLKQALCALYRTFVHKSNPKLYCALEFQEMPSFDLLLLARNLLIDGEATYLALVAELERTWADLPGVTSSDHYPFHFSDAEKTEMERNVSGALLGMRAMQSIQETIGDLFPEQGIVRLDQFEEAKDALRQAKEYIMHTFAKNENEKKVWEKEWPFG
ncbi:hypothetical protein PRK78_004719 [Emydomyces testavorans]|uniref:Uncharacterized protein n=1 Tax=Emydomyces testavorans TaxID=2070801 RepID=A0AAF0DIH2_9EURO|nr:hypothetical protein PRK78_004719 [Emydomyces testavorans]